MPGAVGKSGTSGVSGNFGTEDPSEGVARLRDLVLDDDDGLPHRLGDAWLIRPVVLAFLRHFGCIFCRQRISDLMKRREDIVGSGAGLAVVGLGTPAFAKAFREESGFRGPIYVDREGKAYAAAGLVRSGPIGLLRPRMLLAAFRARRQGHRQTATRGDAWQLGGTLAIAPRDRVVYAWRNMSAEDDAPIDAVVAALRAFRG